jgi:hypothetical protein
MQQSQEKELSEVVARAGARDGITSALDGSVDGMPLDTHLSVLLELRAVLSL